MISGVLGTSTTVDDVNPALPVTLRTLNYWNYGTFLVMGTHRPLSSSFFMWFIFRIL